MEGRLISERMHAKFEIGIFSHFGTITISQPSSDYHTGLRDAEKITWQTYAL